MNDNTLNIRHRSAPPEHVAALIAAEIPAPLAKLYAARGISTADAVRHGLAGLPSPQLLKGIAQAVERLSRAIDLNERICIVADYDADGATACAVGIRGLRALGATVDYLVPNRFEFGYGLTPEIVALAIAEKSPQLIVTVDNGIASVDGVAAARAQGVDVLVTDHHLPAAQLPAALIVNPNQPGCAFPSKAIAGVGVMFYVLMALRTTRDARNVNLAQWLDLVAAGTVADVVALDEVNRTLVEQGIRRMRAGHACAGLRALFAVGGREITNATTQDLGFIVGPRINAAGRLADITLGIECLLTDDADRATEIAAELDALNRERREIEAGMRDEAFASARARVAEDHYTICLMDARWHQGVIGIVAGRLKDALHRPTIVFAPGNGDGALRGSGRSISGFHLRDALDLVSKRTPDLIEKFGGHAMAAGLSIAHENFEKFATAFEAVAQELLTTDVLTRVHWTDGAYSAPQVFANDVAALNSAVWGQGFPAPMFDEVVTVIDQRIVGGKHLKLRVKRESGDIITALLWNETQIPAAQIHVVYKLVVNTFNGKTAPEMMIDAWRGVSA